MKGENQTPFPAILLTTVIDDDRLGGSMIARVTYDIEEGRLTPSAEQPWIASVEPWESPLGAWDPDQPYRKGGVDLFVIGDARAPGGEPATEVELSVEVGAFRARAIAIGPRIWRQGAVGGLTPSDPKPFVALSLGYEAAFGGEVVVDGLATKYPLNPGGRGFYLDEASALHQPLPLLEDPRQRVTQWSDRPDPVGFGLCQYPNPLRLRDAIKVGSAALEPGSPAARFELTPRMFNRAFPQMIAPEVKPGDRAVVSGFSPDGPIVFVIPETRLLVRLALGDKTVERRPVIDEIGVEAAKRRVFIGYRYPFRFVFVPHQRRTCTLLLSEG